MFTNKTSRTEQTSGSQQQFIKPFEERDSDAGSAKAADSGDGNSYMAELEAELDETVFEPIEAACQRRQKELHICL